MNINGCDADNLPPIIDGAGDTGIAFGLLAQCAKQDHFIFFKEEAAIAALPNNLSFLVDAIGFVPPTAVAENRESRRRSPLPGQVVISHKEVIVTAGCANSPPGIVDAVSDATLLFFFHRKRLQSA